MKLFIDTNILLDFLLIRTPFAQFANRLFSEIESSNHTGFIAPITLNNVFYLCRKTQPPNKVNRFLSEALAIMTVIPINNRVAEQALAMNQADFEDALQYQCALAANCDYIISRDLKGFKKSGIPILSAGKFLNLQI